jgi:cytosine/creatinine deaminase
VDIVDEMTKAGFMRHALAQAELGASEGGIPIGSVLVLDSEIVGEGRNRRVQRANPILHAEMDALQAAGRLRASDYGRSTIFTTLSPCWMCSGAILLFGIPRVIIGESRTFRGPEEVLAENGCEVEVLDLGECRELMENFITDNPKLWNEDIGR